LFRLCEILGLEDPDALERRMANRLFMEWMSYFLVKNELEEEAIELAKRRATRESKR